MAETLEHIANLAKAFTTTGRLIQETKALHDYRDVASLVKVQAQMLRQLADYVDDVAALAESVDDVRTTLARLQFVFTDSPD
jgi:acyl carrier protein phosphodiesterase